MVESPLEIVGLSNINFGGFLGNTLSIFVIVIVAVILGVITFLIFRWKNKQTKGVYSEIVWWHDLNGHLVPERSDKAEEITIPGTNLKVFHIKERDTWLPRFTRGIKSNLLYIAVTQNREIVNFTLKSIDKDMAEAGLQYDHTDMRFAAENMREFVKRNFRDKSQKWWQAYKDVITTAIFILLMTFSLVIIIYFLRGVVQDINGIAGSLNTAIEKLNLCAQSGATAV